MGTLGGEPGRNMSMGVSARLVAEAAWWEERLYEVLGTWAGSATGAAPKVFLDSASQHHAWRSSLWLERLPARLVAREPRPSSSGADISGPDSSGADSSGAELSGADIPGAGTSGAVWAGGPGSPGATAAIEALARLEGDAARLGAYCRAVLPYALVGYRRWQRACSPVSDRPVARALAIVLNDLVSDWQEGCEVLADVLSGGKEGGSGGAVAAAAGSVAQIDGLLLGEARPQSA